MLDLHFSNREERDRQYNARDTVPDYMVFVNEYTELSRQVRETVPGFVDLAYGQQPAEKLDLFIAPGKQPAPVFVFIHGGYWRALSKDDSSLMANVFTQAGVAVAALDYALAPAATLEEMVRQTRSAIAWLYRHAAQYGIDPQQIHIGGSSAGGHLAGMLLASGWQREFKVPENVIRSACLLSGLFDIVPLCDTHINEWMQLTPERAQLLSPLFHLPDHACSLTLAVGGRETDGFKRQTAVYAQAWQQRGFPLQIVDMPQQNHFDLVLELADVDSPLTQAVLRQITYPGSGTACQP